MAKLHSTLCQLSISFFATYTLKSTFEKNIEKRTTAVILNDVKLIGSR